MIRFSAEAILASSTSKSGVRIPLTEHEDLRSSTDSTISTSLIYSVASVGNCEQVHTSVLIESCLPKSECCWCGEFVKMRIRNLQSLLVCPIIIWESSLTWVEWMSGWRSWLASRIQIWCLAFTHHMWWCVFWRIRDPRIRLLRIRCWRRRPWICKNVSRCTMRVPNVWRLIVAARHSPRERLSVPPGSRKSGKNAGWLATWDCPLRTDSVPIKTLESFIQLTSFCSSWILAVGSRTVSRSSISFLLENPTNVDPWNRSNSSISLRLFIWASRRSRFCSNNCSWRSCWSRRSCSSPAWARLISLRWDSIIPFNFWILLVS